MNSHLRNRFITRLLATLAIGAAVSCFTSTAPKLYAQSDQGSINGAVVDASGAAVSGAHIIVVNQDTGFRQDTISASGGIYAFPPLKVGVYTLTVTAPGFETLNQKNVVVTVSTTRSVPLSLQAGSENQIVSRSVAPPPLQTDDAATGTWISVRSVVQTPIVNRDFPFIAQLSPGVAPSPEGARGEPTGNFSANGQRPEQNNYILDGVDNNVNLVDFPNFSNLVIVPPPDALQEFRVQTTDYTAELGHSLGAVVNASVRSGTNGYHGGAWEYFRNDALDARDYFPEGAAKPEYRQNEFGGTFGGPILRNHLFFFGDFQENRIVFGQTAEYTVPTPLMRTGDFSELLNPSLVGGAANVRQLYHAGGPTPGNPTSNLQQYQGRPNVFDPSTLDPVALHLIDLFPTPNLGGVGQTTNNFQYAGKAQVNTTQFDFRTDWNISPKDQVFARYSYSSSPSTYPSPFGSVLDGGTWGSTGSINDQGRNFTSSYTHVLTPSISNEVRFGYNWLHALSQQENGGTDVAKANGLGGIPYGPLNGGLPYFQVSGLSTFGSYGYLITNEYENVAQLLDNLTKVKGHHTIRVGVNFERIRVQTVQPVAPRGQYSFTGLYTEDPANSASTGYGVADFLKGSIEDSAITTAATVHNQRWSRAGYIQDGWKVNPKLTVNVGLRYEYVQPLEELDGHQANFIPNYSAGSGVFLLPNKVKTYPIPATFLAALAKDNIAVQYTSNNFLVNPDKKDFAPRAGISYLINDTTVLRAGYGMFYGGLESVGFYPNLGENSPFEIDSDFPSPGTCSVNGCPTNGQTLATGFSKALAVGLGNFAAVPALRSYQVNVQTPYSEQYNLALEKSFSNWTATATYVGAGSHHLQVNPDVNQALTPDVPGGNGQQLRPFPDFGKSSIITYGGFSSYNGLQTSLKHRYSNGFLFLASYTYSHSLDDAIYPIGSYVGQGGGYRNWRALGLGYDYGTSLQDVRQRFTLNGFDELPFGRGKKYLNQGGLLNGVVGGWESSFTFRAQTGEPEIVYPNNNSTNGVGTSNAVRVGNPFASTIGSSVVKTKTVANWINPAAFVNPSVANGVSAASDLASYGPPGKTTFAGPGYYRVDLSATKSLLAFRESKVQLKGELYNVLNTPALGQPANTLGSGFGSVSSERFNGPAPDARTLQLALKYVF